MRNLEQERGSLFTLDPLHGTYLPTHNSKLTHRGCCETENLAVMEHNQNSYAGNPRQREHACNMRIDANTGALTGHNRPPTVRQNSQTDGRSSSVPPIPLRVEVCSRRNSRQTRASLPAISKSGKSQGKKTDGSLKASIPRKWFYTHHQPSYRYTHENQAQHTALPSYCICYHVLAPHLSRGAIQVSHITIAIPTEMVPRSLIALWSKYADAVIVCALITIQWKS